jgi:hypothetical protein
VATMPQKVLACLVTLVPWLIGGISLYEICRAVSCTLVLAPKGSSYNFWCNHISWDFRPDLLLLSPILLLIARRPSEGYPSERASPGIRTERLYP